MSNWTSCAFFLSRRSCVFLPNLNNKLTYAGEVGLLEAVDYDTPKNGPPFTFRIDPKAPTTFKNKFGVRRRRVGGANGDDYAYYLETRKEFDREAQKVYNIPIEIADNQGLKAVSLLKLTIGDKNDNPMKPGASEIFVYNYEGRAPTTQEWNRLHNET